MVIYYLGEPEFLDKTVVIFFLFHHLAYGLEQGHGMNLPSAPIEARVSTDRQSQGDTRLHGHWLVLAMMLWLALGWFVVGCFPVLILGAAHPWDWSLSPLYALVRIAFYCSLALALLYRYRWVSTPVQRQQIKWVVFALTIFIVEVMVVELIVFLVPSYFPALGLLTQIYQRVKLITPLLAILIPLAIGIALLRYRLWDIDIIINRTLVYGALTGTLALVYFILIIALQFLVRSLTGQVLQPPLVIVASTLAIAALSQPLRDRPQALIDRRFYRRKYDATKTVAAFSATLRQEVDLDQLREHLLAVAHETMQPTHVSLWLPPPAYAGKQRAPWRANPPVSSEGK